MYPEEIWEAIQRHPSGKDHAENTPAYVDAPDMDDEWGIWLEATYDPDAPVPYLPTDRIEDLEI